IVAGDDAPLPLVVEPEAGDRVVLAVEDPRLDVRRRRRQTTEPAAKGVPLLAHQLRNRGAVAELDGATQIAERERVDLQGDESATPVILPSLASECAVLEAEIPAQHTGAER